MSRLVQIRRGGKAATLVTGTLSGSGNLSIPQGASIVSLTGRGGDGTNNYWYNPGTPPTYVNTWSSTHTIQYVWANNSVTSGATTYGSGTGPTPSNSANTYDLRPGDPEFMHSSTYYVSTGSTMTDPGTPPSSGGGPQYGTSTTATLNGTTRTWTGGYDSGVQGTTSTQTLESNGAGQTLSYSVASTGTLSYSYEY